MITEHDLPVAESMDDGFAPTTAPDRSSTRRTNTFLRRAGFPCGLALMVLVILAARGWGPFAAESGSAPLSAAMPASAAIEATYGVRIESVAVTAGGGMIQLRYQILDGDKAEALHGTEAAPAVVSADGTVYADPGMAGHSHVGKTGASGSSDTLLLADARGAVHRGDVVTVRIGSLELRGVHVQ